MEEKKPEESEVGHNFTRCDLCPWREWNHYRTCRDCEEFYKFRRDEDVCKRNDGR